MNIRDENVLRELNLYPLWVRRDLPAPEEVAPVVAQAEARVAESIPVEPAAPVTISRSEHVAVATDWAGLKQQVRDCTACKLRAGCTQTVFGVGDENADWLFVGEGPGADEDAQGEPFVGQAGKLLDNMLAAIKLKRGDNVYIANIVKCRPPGNRTPEADEIATCLPYLRQQIALIKPKLIVALGKTAATSLLGREATLGSLRGTIHDFEGTPLLVTYHPAYLLRSPAEKAKAWQDLCEAVRLMSARD
ncbi:MAG: uracil-DNA glycosylase [Gammaproteobacteria bacterium]|nr:uracil-DNA glycosylase [Gammaproteobacteria bacterium]MBU1969772.1 uracil-DNA glycosylase [Gammaproteobacteria bacterium]